MGVWQSERLLLGAASCVACHVYSLLRYDFLLQLCDPMYFLNDLQCLLITSLSGFVSLAVCYIHDLRLGSMYCVNKIKDINNIDIIIFVHTELCINMLLVIPNRR